MRTHLENTAAGLDAAHALAGVITRADRDALARQVLRTCTDDDRHYAELLGLVRDGPVLDGIRAMIDLLCALLADDAAAEDEARRAVRRTITDHRRLGLPATMACDATQAICQTVWRALIEIAEPAERAVLTVAAGRVIGAGKVLAELAQLYSRSPADHPVGIEQHSRKLLGALVDPAVIDLPSEPLHVLGFRPSEGYRAFAVAADLRIGLGVALDVRGHGGVAVTHDHAVVGVLPEGIEWSPTARQSASAVSEPVGRRQLAGELEFVLVLARVARELGHRGALAEDDLLIERLLLRSPSLLELVAERVIAPLAARGRRAQLVGTLVAFVDADFHRRRAAGDLNIHPGSLTYRLQRIEKATRLRFGRQADLMLLTLGARAHQLVSVQAEEPSV